jgi:hypothetical protein
VDWMFVNQGRDESGPCEHGNEPSGSIKVGNFLTE